MYEKATMTGETEAEDDRSSWKYIVEPSKSEYRVLRSKTSIYLLLLGFFKQGGSSQSSETYEGPT
jgi:hypothetical protein